jgi:hypothetical protein
MPKITLTVYLYDLKNGPLQHPGISIDVYDAVTSVLLATDVSQDLNPPKFGPPSKEWGGSLKFTVPTNNPIDLLFTDASFKYPGNTLRNVNGDISRRLDVDLRRLPAGKGGQKNLPTSAAPSAITRWVDSATKWDIEEKEAVKQLVFNYCGLIVARQGDPITRSNLSKVNANWETALNRLGIPPSLLTQG